MLAALFSLLACGPAPEDAAFAPGAAIAGKGGGFPGGAFPGGGFPGGAFPGGAFPGGGDDLRWPGATWDELAPAEVGADASLLEDAFDYAAQPRMNTQSVVVVKDGAIIGEWYDSGEDADSVATSWSMAKSVVSALIGMHLDEGTIGSLDDSIADYLTDWAGTPEAAVTLRDLLEMRSGLSSAGDASIYWSSDALASALSRSLRYTPGTHWAYINQDTQLLGGALEVISGAPLAEHADAILLSRLGIEATWWSDLAGNTLAYCCMDATSRDFARFGLLYARGGAWDGEQLVPAAYVRASTHAPLGSSGYGYQWWLPWWSTTENLFMAVGYHEQYIYVFPDRDLVVVRNGDYTHVGPDAVTDGTSYHDTTGATGWSDEAFLALILDAFDGP